MAGHNLVIKLQSGNQVEQITVSEEAVDLLMPGTPAETIAAARDTFVQKLGALLNAKKQALADVWASENITVQS